MGDLVHSQPKPMLTLGKRTIVEHIVSHLADHGAREILINLHYSPEAIVRCLGDGRDWGVRIQYFHESALLGTAGALRPMAETLGEEPFLVHYGDVVTNHNLTNLVDRHHSRNPLATILVHERERSNSVVSFDEDGRVSSFLERPDEAERSTITSRWVNSGIAVLSPSIFQRIPCNGYSDLPRDVYRALVPSGELFAAPLSGYRCAVDSPERLEQARDAAARGVIVCKPRAAAEEHRS
jgi:NDP-sugar pyrophosphorylase family protein